MSQSETKKDDGQGFELSILDFKADFENVYNNFSDSNLFQLYLEKFSSVDNGVLFYEFAEGSGHEKFVILNQIENEFSRISSDPGIQSTQDFKNSRIAELLQRLDNRNYYEWPQKDFGHSKFSLFAVKRNGKLWSAYVAPMGKSSQPKSYGDQNVLDRIELIELVNAR